MAQPVKLSEILDGMDLQSDDIHSYVDKKTGQVISLSSEQLSELTASTNWASPTSGTSIDDGLVEQAQALLGGERDFLANAANLAAMLYHSLIDVNWVGWYFLREKELVLGPFQGKPACTRIPLGKGVCGTAAAQRQTLVVADVHKFPGHIACDAASKSEIVIPVVRAGQLLGVLDLDSPLIGRFDADDQAGLERLVEVFLAASGPLEQDGTKRV